MGDLLHTLFSSGLDSHLGDEDFAALIKVVEGLDEPSELRRG
jgi:hypothetical protein